MKLQHADYRRISRIMNSAGSFFTESYNRVYLEGYFPEFGVEDTDDGRIVMLHKYPSLRIIHPYPHT